MENIEHAAVHPGVLTLPAREVLDKEARPTRGERRDVALQVVYLKGKLLKPVFSPDRL
jgi:hypothetical protein